MRLLPSKLQKNDNCPSHHGRSKAKQAGAFPKNSDVPEDMAREYYKEWKKLNEPNVRKGDKCEGKRNDRERERQKRRRKEKANRWEDMIVGSLLVFASLALSTATVVEDVATGGAGVVDDPVSFAAAGAMAARGMALLRGAAAAGL